MKRWSLALLAPVLCGAGPASLLVGVVHDQFGRPIAGARVQVASHVTATDVAGTFALAGANAGGVVVVSCDYCETARITAASGEPVVVIVRRYDAVAQEGPTDRDVDAMHYSRASSAVSLRPYAVLNDSSQPEPGARVSLYGISSFWGGLTIDDGIPSYDIAAGTSTFPFFPALAPQRIAYAGSEDAFRYGDNAGAGTFFVDTRSDPGTPADAMFGDESAGRIAQSGGGFSGSAGFSSSSTDSRDRADATISVPLGQDAFDATVIASGSRQYSVSDQSLDAAFNAARLAYSHNGSVQVQADVLLDESGYNGTMYEGGGVSGAWSDFETDASVESSGAVRAFADASLRSSTGLYSDTTLGAGVAGSVTQDHLDAGAQFGSPQFNASAGAGFFSFGYNGGNSGTNQPLSSHIVTPSVSLNFSPSPQWNASFSSSEYFRLPTLAEVYAPPAATELQFERSPVTVGKISFGDLHRLRVELIDIGGGDHATGANLAWEIAPDVSLRAWTLEFSNTFEQTSGTVNAFWVTYENPGGVRVDLDERRDLEDLAENQHLDAALSFPVAPHVRFFTVTERPTALRLVKAGIEVAP